MCLIWSLSPILFSFFLVQFQVTMRHSFSLTTTAVVKNMPSVNTTHIDLTAQCDFILETFTKLLSRPIQTQCTLLLLSSGLYFCNPFKETDSPEIVMAHCFLTQSLCLGQHYFCFYQISVFTDICYLFSAVLMYPITKVCYFVIFWFLKFTF